MKVGDGKARGPTAGSNAGRGFRYQDFLGALYVVRTLLGEARFAEIIPEGSDDLEIRGPEGAILVDAKSKRPEVRARSASANAAALKALWARPIKAGAEVLEYWLVLERPPGGSTDATIKLVPTSGSQPEVHRSFVIVEPDPIRTAITLLVERRSLSPLAAELVVLALAREVGALASANGPLALEDRKSITATEAERIATRVLSAVDANRLERLVRTGVVEPVDFTRSIDDPGFYLGVDVQPGHFVAGLALERPVAVRGVLEALAPTRAAVLVGPSGAGKSSLMWNSVIAAREGRRWFCVSSVGLPDDDAVTAFFHAYADAGPIGFVVDDIGRGRVEIWRRLRELCSSRPEALLIGSIRAEDAALLPNRHSISEVSVSADQQLAKALWERLRDHKQTAWPGWHEPWTQSNGLLLEYGHILTQGKRLEAVITEQIRERVHGCRDHELAVLSASALAMAHGGAVRIEALRAELHMSAGDIARALDRLLAEHLVRVDVSGTELIGLHALRAASISLALAHIGYSSELEQARLALRVTSIRTIESVAAGVIVSGAMTFNEGGEVLATRLACSSSMEDWARSLRGVRVGGLTLLAKSWLEEADARGMAPKFATAAAGLGLLHADDVADIGNMREMAASGRQLVEAVAGQKPPAPLVAGLIERVCAAEKESDAPRRLANALAALTGASLDKMQVAQLAMAGPAFDTWAIENVVGVLDAALSVHPDIASAWARSLKGTEANADALARLGKETAFALPIWREETSDGLILHGDVYEAVIGPAESPNDLLVAHCHAMLMVEPSARIAHARLIDAKGETTPHLDSEKRIPRGHSPPHALAQWNRRAIDAVAREVGSQSWSAYLTKGQGLLAEGHKALHRLFDSTAVGRFDQLALDTLNAVNQATDHLIGPFEPNSASIGSGSVAISGRHLTPLQNVVFGLNATLVRDVARLPVEAPLLAARVRGYINLVGQARSEPWELIGDGPPPLLDEVKSTLHDLELIALEAEVSAAAPLQRWPKANGKPKGAFELVARGSRTSFRKRIEERRKSIETTIAAHLPRARVIAPVLDDGVIWRTRFVACFPVSSLVDLKTWVVDARSIGVTIRGQLTEDEDVCLVPLINGWVVADYAHQCSRSFSQVDDEAAFEKEAALLGRCDNALLQRVGAPVLSKPETIATTFLALRDIAGMFQLGLGGPDCPAEEVERLNQASRDLCDHGPALLSLFEGEDYAFLKAIQCVLHVLLTDAEFDPEEPVSFDGVHSALVDLTWRRATNAVTR